MLLSLVCADTFLPVGLGASALEAVGYRLVGPASWSRGLVLGFAANLGVAIVLAS